LTVIRSYHVFGRTAYDEPLRELELLAAGSDEQARSESLKRHGEGLIELSLVPEDDVVWILRREESEQGENVDDDDSE
jgi:hypothetical protein